MRVYCYNVDLPQAIDKEFFSDVVPTIGVFKGEVEFVIFGQKVKTLFGISPGTGVSPACSINVNLDVFAKLTSVL